MSDDKIVLDKKSFKSLASESRVNIIKSLERRRKTLTELSKQFSMSPSTVKEHLENMVGAGLIVQVDDGHKWKYYELTRKGREIVSPTGSGIYVILGLSLFAVVFTAWDLLRTSFRAAVPMLSGREGEFADAAKDALVEQAPAAAGDSLGAAALFIPYAHILGIAVFTAIFGISLGYLIARRIGTPELLD